MTRIKAKYEVQIFRSATADELFDIFTFWRNSLEIELHKVDYANCGTYHELTIVYCFKN